ncbi:MAG: M28 family peptidase [Saprospiraceae bacterium]|nr:M28 family peptidase [Saprospiraceae bacterium]MCF8248311.1 M28 family peptidase [Saprospiraceae bacterium]MCF8279935.1 M28 family peptidase [Bacteroidales bacterium]MCF8309839.1 M28 family peptidase [Saprospiraceae bacterium]MCF8438830.1 M28 family peptidase [Saprospiraceae bacterium]
MPTKSIFISSIALFFISISTAFGQDSAKSIQNLQVDVVYLASNLLEGREVGKPGSELAARYIASRFEKIGLEPKGEGGSWFHPFDFQFNSNPHATGGGESRIGKNVVGYINNNAENTVVIGAHYDHLGMGMPGTSLYVGDPAVHNGADDNASGVASLLFLAEYLKNSNLSTNNYLFLAFSAEELGLIGSKKFVENPSFGLDNVNYMLNMDMVGRLNEEKVLAINGAGTSPVWKDELEKILVGGIKIKTTDSGIGPSDHTSFYLQDMPVLHFFTGQHTDYHKPSDDSELVNYQGIYDVSMFIATLVKNLNDADKLVFTKTKDESQQGASFKVTLGVMPDYVFDGEGMRIDAVMDDRPAKKAGLEKGDIVLQIGDVQVKTIYDYMDGLAKFKKGDKAMVKVKRKEDVIEKEVEF